MTDTIWQHNLATFADKIASSDPTPGGGSVSLVSATFGAALVAMAIRVTLKKKEVPAREELTAILAQVDELQGKLAGLADADIASFETFMAAYGLPKAEPAEQAVRKTALSAAALEACGVPLTAAETVVAALALADTARPLVSAMIVSDVDAGKYLLRAAGQAVLLNVDANLSSLAEETRAGIVEKATALRQTLAG